jgi:hypothetical protein
MRTSPLHLFELKPVFLSINGAKATVMPNTTDFKFEMAEAKAERLVHIELDVGRLDARSQRRAEMRQKNGGRKMRSGKTALHWPF